MNISSEYRNNPSKAGPARNEQKQNHSKRNRQNWYTKPAKNPNETDNDKPLDTGEIREYLSREPKQVIPLDLDDIKPEATLLDTLRDQLRYCDNKDMLTIKWLLKVAPEQIVLVITGNGRYSYQSKHIERVIQGIDHKEVTKVFTSTHCDPNNKVHVTTTIQSANHNSSQMKMLKSNISFCMLLAWESCRSDKECGK